MPGKKRVLISGAGVAGIACAILLDREKYDVELIEQGSTFRNIGFSIILWRNGFRILEALAERSHMRLKEGEDLFEVDAFRLFGKRPLKFLREFDSSGYAWAIKREHLMELLESMLHVVDARGVMFSRSVRHIRYESENSPATVVFRDGTEAQYDIVIIAEGAHSSSRELIAVQEQVASEPYALRYTWFTTPTELGPAAGMFFQKGQVGIIHPPYTSNILGFYFEKGTSEEAQRAFEREIEAFVKQPSGSDSRLDLKTSDTFELKEVHLDTYAARNAVVIGDAAHGRPPTLGFGTTLALEDAAVLAARLNVLTDVGQEAITAALSSFSKERHPRVEAVYRFQARIQQFYTKSKTKFFILLFLQEVLLGSLIEKRVKELVSYEMLP